MWNVPANALAVIVLGSGRIHEWLFTAIEFYLIVFLTRDSHRLRPSDILRAYRSIITPNAARESL